MQIQQKLDTQYTEDLKTILLSLEDSYSIYTFELFLLAEKVTLKFMLLRNPNGRNVFFHE